MKLYFEGKLQYLITILIIRITIIDQDLDELTKIEFGHKKSYSQISDKKKISPLLCQNVWDKIIYC